MKRIATLLCLVLCCAASASPGRDLAGRWTGAYTKEGGSLRVNAELTLDDDDALLWSERVPDWIVYGWFDPEPVTIGEDGAVRVPSLYGGATLRYDEERDEMAGVCVESGVALHLKRTMPAPPVVRPREVPVEFGEDVRLAGTLVLPEGEGPFPCVVMIHPRGCYDRAVGLRRGRFFAQYGVATLAYDQRGAGGSEGSCDGRTFDELVTDARAALRCAQEHASIDAERVGVLGVSAGAWVCQRLAGEQESNGTPLGFVVTWVGPATSVAQQQRDSARELGRGLGLDDEDIRLVLEHVDLQLDPARTVRLERFRAIEMRAREGGWLDAMFAPDDFPEDAAGIERLWLPRHRFDPGESLRVLSATPYLAVFGEEDPIVPLDTNRVALETQLSDAGNARLEVVTLPGLGHDLSRPDETRVLEDGTRYHAFARPDPRPFIATLHFLQGLGCADAASPR